MLPVVPLPEVPELNTNDPLMPFAPAFTVRITTLPLVLNVPKPAIMDTVPPVAPLPLPAVISIDPP
jgi:hypothetical protein